MNKKGLLTLTQYAAHRKVSKAAVSKAVKEGRITLVVDPATGKRSVDPITADKEWTANTVAGQKSAAGVNGQPPPGEAKPADDKPKGPSYADSRAIREAYAARMSKLEYQEKMGSLMSVEKVKSDSFRMARITRDAILAIPDRISHELAATTDQHTVHVTLTKALIEALDQLVRENAN